MAADLVFLLVLFYSVVFGARRGFFKEVVHGIALVVGVAVARMSCGAVGAQLSTGAGMPRLVAEVAAALFVWAATFLVVAVVGRLILKKLRGKGADDRLDDGAEAIADAISGDTTKGPVTLLTDPIASKNGVFYWGDKILGALLGLIKGVVTAYVLFGLVIWADRVGHPSAFASSIETSHATALFRGQIQPYLEAFPEYRLVSNATEMREIARLVQEDPSRFDAFTGHAQLGSLARDPKINELAGDPEIQKAWKAHDLAKLLGDQRVRDLLADPALRDKVAAVDWKQVRESVEHGAASATTPPGAR
jgi:uncharacterized membrane protein required for colicin V production